MCLVSHTELDEILPLTVHEVRFSKQTYLLITCMVCFVMVDADVVNTESVTFQKKSLLNNSAGRYLN